ncbi:MAG: GGDEF domain-containing response regulator [Nitrospirota bacterium]
MTQVLRVLLIEDSPDDAALLLRELQRGTYQITHDRVDTADALNVALDRQPWDLVLADYSMPQFDGMTALRLVRGKGLDLPFIFVSGTIGEDTAVEAMKAGANDYVMKDNLKRLLPAVQRELREAASRRARRLADAMVHRMAYCDPLTHLPNRNRLYDRLQEGIQGDTRHDKIMALLLMDLNGFKEINDTLGHYRGDHVLQQVGARLRAVLWEPDLVARLGGDEFAVLLPRLATAADVHVVIQKILNALQAPVVIQGLPLAVRASLGVALYPEHGDNPDTLLRRADVAMYAAKKTGEYVIYDASHDQHSPLRLALSGALQQAIGTDQFRLHYQPKIAFATRRIVGVEALARWHHPDYHSIPPDEFIPTAEQTGLIKSLTRWVLVAACRQWETWQRAGVRLGVAVNLSARNLHDPNLPDQVADVLSTYGMPPSALHLEITESAVMTDLQRAKSVLARLREVGTRLAVDDFGTGYSSLGYLKDLPVHEIKIDKSFVHGVAKDAHAITIVGSIISLGHHLGLDVTAEGVEDQAAWEQLAALGCDAAQGYYMGRPLAADELESWLNESPWGLNSGQTTSAAA